MSAQGRESKLIKATLDTSNEKPRLQGRRRGVTFRDRMARQLRLAASRIYDPRVHFNLYDARLGLPLSHDLPSFMRAFPEYGTNIGRIALAVAGPNVAAAFVDIGANIGDTAHIIRHHVPTAPILSIEGDPFYFQLLQQNVRSLPNVETSMCLLGQHSDPSGGSIARVRGTGHMLTHKARAAESSRIITLTALLREHAKFACPTLIKIDTDGYDFAIIWGALDTLAQAAPVLFFEYDPSAATIVAPDGPTGLATLARLAEIGYGVALVYDNLGFPLVSIDLADDESVRDLDVYCSLRSPFYLDICAFPQKQAVLARQLRGSERAYFSTGRSN